MVSESEMIPIRIKFTKTGNLVYISHLDLQKTMQKIIVRSGIDIWYSEGFNPQPKISFATPLPIGVESECEFLDLRLNSDQDLNEIKDNLQNNFPSEMKVLKVYKPTTKIKDLVYYEYEIKIHALNVDSTIPDKINDLFSKDVFVTKKSKDKEKQINISEYIESIDAQIQSDGDILIHTILFSNSEKNLNPELLIEALRNEYGILCTSLIDEYYSIKRIRALNANKKEFE